MIVQIYEIQTPQEAEKCIELGVDHIGSVLVSGKDWRLPILKEVMLLSADGGCKSSLIPLFTDRETLYRALDYYRPDFVHFCDSLTDAGGLESDLGAFIQMQGLLKETFPDIGIMRSIPIPPQGASEDFPTLSIAARLQPVTDIFLTDTWLGQGPVVGYIGITGRPADWDMARELVLQSRIPVILAGGLSPENVREAILKVTPSGADSCTRTNLVDSRGAPVRFEKTSARWRVSWKRYEARNGLSTSEGNRSNKS